jgi:hypothetical protein
MNSAMPKDLHRALVRIMAEPSGAPIGSGFVCYQDAEGTLILTCRTILKWAAESGDGEQGGESPVWIDGLYPAVPVFDGGDQIDLAALRCTSPALRDRPALPLGRPLFVGDTRIIKYESIRFSDTRRVEERPFVCAYQVLSDSESEIILRNDSEFAVGSGDVGSPVIDQNYVIGVVTHAARVTASRPDPVQHPQR